MPDIQAVLLDLDGTLLDAFTPIVRAMRQTLHDFHLPELSEQEIRRHTGKGDCSMKALFGDAHEAAVQHFVQLHDEDYLTGIHPLDGAERLLQHLHEQHIPTAIVTSKGQQRAEVQMQHLDWLPLVDCIVGKVDGRASKPNPASLYLAADALHTPIASCVMVGDGIADMQASVRSGAYGVGLNHAFSTEELTDAGAQRIFSHLDEVHTWLNTQIH